jgi:ribosomal protein S18 acetylase RimI-like enzyme
MGSILQDISDPQLPHAIDANFAEELACFGRSLPGAELCGDDELLWFSAPATYFHGILRCHLPNDDVETINIKLDHVMNYFKARHLPIAFSVGPTARPANLKDYLIARGFVHERTKIAMAINIAEIQDGTPPPQELTLQEITDTETLGFLRTIEIQGFDSSETMAQAYYDTYVHSGFGAGTSWHHFLAWQHNTPVAIASLLLHAGVAGIYGVATIPEARRQAVATAITLHALRTAHSLGYRVAVLAPSEMSINLYHRIGFQERCTFDFYFKSPE